MNSIKLFTSEVFKVSQRDFWVLIGCNLTIGILFKLIETHPFIQFISILFLLLKTMNFLRNSSIWPTGSSAFDRYSWKYFQSLPLTKKELILSLVITDFLMMIPVIVWALSFSSQIGDVFSADVTPIETKLKILMAAIPFLFLISFLSLKNLICHPRRQYSKVDSKIILYKQVKSFSILAFVICYGFFVLKLIESFLGLGIVKFAEMVIKGSYLLVTSWWVVPLLIILTLRQYFVILKIWQNEHIGYIKADWKPKRDLSIIAICTTMTVGLINHLDLRVPHYFRESPLTRSVYTNDFEEVSELLKEGLNINESNAYGFTPLMVAVQSGNFEMFQFLLKHEAILKGEIKKSSISSFNGMDLFLLAVDGGNLKIIGHLLMKGYNPQVLKEDSSSALHIAAKKCNTKMVDFLLTQKIKINAINKDGQTPLHLAARRGCFGTVATLLEAGVNPLLKDRKGKLAKDYIHNNILNKELAYYLEKRSRAPANH